MIDLRSDTVTRPTEGMRRAMYAAEVGDDVLGDDPTVLRLQEEVATLLGKEAALFVPSGTMGNQLALKCLTEPGDEVILDRSSHIFNYETAAAGLLSGVQLLPVDARDVLRPDEIRAAVRPRDYWMPRTRLVCLENTLNQRSGLVYPLAILDDVCAAAREFDLSLHLDGARLWNATAASGIAEHRYAAPFDTVNVCLSKGLGAPVGSVLAGSRDLIERARRFRKIFGGGMRQAGILAAAGLYALAHHRSRLAEDHEKARLLASALADLPGFYLIPDQVQTNIVFFSVRPGKAETILSTLKQDGILMSRFGADILRATTHLDVSSRQIKQVIHVLRKHFSQDRDMS